ncbi:hypothetical protein CXG81DRAFT_27001 [Caulochytrium protostelioides]|uniref:Uncharacterized protein n=1 Tax=Caulochytrium protostelioides TaxID=1555241 RepID=A0A4P9X573_9FUNG|nr:hypothetical protein CXG81DRAFT_27001 [Caulochytrium protostelioides]|eukprot:RKP00277.1 hypothetical protein CXG81DRAFT_27001 [Caulochytrium protostelioides]
MPDELHGLFQFVGDGDGDGSDAGSDAGSDLFAPAPKARHTIEWDWTAPLTSRGGVLPPVLADPDAVLQTKRGATQLVHAANALFMDGKDAQALDLCTRVLQHPAAGATLHREVGDMAARCCLRLGEPARALALFEASPAPHGSDAGFPFLHAQLLAANHRFVDAVHTALRYLALRGQDPVGMRHVAEIVDAWLAHGSTASADAADAADVDAPATTSARIMPRPDLLARFALRVLERAQHVSALSRLSIGHPSVLAARRGAHMDRACVACAQRLARRAGLPDPAAPDAARVALFTDAELAVLFDRRHLGLPDAAQQAAVVHQLQLRPGAHDDGDGDEGDGSAARQLSG